MITVLTPTYNRAYTLTNAYESLQCQTDYNFEWIIVDDGSTDNTEKLVSDWLNETRFSISYYRQPNGGKHRAVNFGVNKAEGDFILILDSDDTLTEDCIDFLNEHIPEVRSDQYAGLAGLKGFSGKDGVIGGQKNDGSYVDATNIERVRLHLDGDKAEAYKTSIMKKYPFPEFKGEKFLAEGASWNRIALDGYKIRWYNHVIYKCEYLEDGLTKNKTSEALLNNFKGYTYNTVLDVHTKPFPYNYLSIGNYSILAKEKGYDRAWIKKKLKISSGQYILGQVIMAAHDIVKR
jgi:glycosyltransferase involved in cell wall biosynthesis